MRATVEHKPLPLSAKEFSLLRYLVSRQGETVSRAEILQEVWGTTRHIDPTIVDQYVRYLRRKLDPVIAGVAIVTLRGSGYSLVAQGS